MKQYLDYSWFSQSIVFDCSSEEENTRSIPEAGEGSYYLSTMFRGMFIVRPGTGFENNHL